MDRKILIYGGLDFADNAEFKRRLTEALGGMVIKEDMILATGGAIGKGDGILTGGVDFHAALGARNYLNNVNLEEERIITILPNSNAESCFQMGKVMFDNAKDMKDRRNKLLGHADAVITIEGGPGVIEIGKLSFFNNKLILPLGGTGGASFELWKDENFISYLCSKLDISKLCDEINIVKQENKNIGSIVNVCKVLLGEYFAVNRANNIAVNML